MSLQIETNYNKDSKLTSTTKVNAVDTPVKIIMVKKVSSPGDSLNINKVILPKEIDKQLEIVFRNSKLEMEDMALWLKALGGYKVRKDVIKMFSDKKFNKELINIFTNARKIDGNQDKNVADLVKDNIVLGQVFDCFKGNAPKNTLLSTLLSMPIIKSQFGKMVDKNKHYVLLYGEPKK